MVLAVLLGLVIGVCALVNPVPPELAPSPSGAPVLWLEVLVDCCSVL